MKKLMSKFNTVSSISIVLAILVTTPGYSQDIRTISPGYSQDIRTISPGRASGEQGALPRLQVWPGSGLNISFSKTGEYLQKVWLDDPSRITADFDAPISSGNAQSIHLKRINALKFENLPTSPSTLLTVITNQNRYQFVLSYGKGSPQYYGVIIAQPVRRTVTFGGSDLPSSLRIGLQKALSEGLISPNQGNMVLVTRVNQAISLVTEGRTLNEAAALSGVSPQFLTRLQTMGQTEQFSKQLGTGPGVRERSLETPLDTSILDLFYPDKTEFFFKDYLLLKRED